MRSNCNTSPDDFDREIQRTRRLKNTAPLPLGQIVVPCHSFGFSLLCHEYKLGKSRVQLINHEFNFVYFTKSSKLDVDNLRDALQTFADFPSKYFGSVTSANIW